METTAGTSKKEALLSLTKEELVEKLLKAQKEVVVHHDFLKETFKECKDLRQKCSELEKLLSKTVGEGYQDDFSWVSKIVFVLKKENRPLRSADIISILERKESFLRNRSDKAKLLSAYINKAVKYERIGRQKVKGVRGFYYLLPEWLDDKGNLLQSFKVMMI